MSSASAATPPFPQNQPKRLNTPLSLRCHHGVDVKQPAARSHSHRSACNFFGSLSVRKTPPIRHAARPTLSPLMRALSQSRVAREPVIDLMLLKCYAALDAFCRAQGSHALLTTLRSHVLIARELARIGYASERVNELERAEETLTALDASRAATSQWNLDAAAHRRLCDALALFAAQLDAASLEHIARAQASAVTQSLMTARATPRELAPSPT
ncbi:hypothetical protein [Caballeronia sp. GAWG1-5s-s]|uniref:hypothetical protein n=1 Tax=Caballeronia sp. GAWG1-5s-s TaxID=2921743 RepID=UPI0020286CB1|nr:hypothetical protein [Caballeronia sp. GAWG1-5s-s]